MAHLKATEYKYRLTMSESKINTIKNNTILMILPSFSVKIFHSKLMRKIKNKINAMTTTANSVIIALPPYFHQKS